MPSSPFTVPGASNLMNGTDLSSAVAGETDEERRKRLLAQAQNRLLPNTAGNPGASSLGLSIAGYGAGAGPGSAR
jgi:hypothetical protein